MGRVREEVKLALSKESSWLNPPNIPSAPSSTRSIARTIENLANLVAPDVRYTLMGYELPELDGLDRDALLQTLPDMMAMFEDDSPHLKITNVISQGNWVAVESEGIGTFRNGAPYKNRYGVFFEVVDGKIRTIREYMDTQHRATLLTAATEA